MVAFVFWIEVSLVRFFRDNASLGLHTLYDFELFQGVEDRRDSASALYCLGKFCCNFEFFDLEAESLRFRRGGPDGHIKLFEITSP